MIAKAEELAKEHGARISRKSVDGLIKRLEFTVDSLEAFRKACVADYFESSEPVSYLIRRSDWPEGELKPFLQNHKWASVSVPLYTKPKEAE